MPETHAEKPEIPEIHAGHSGHLRPSPRGNGQARPSGRVKNAWKKVFSIGFVFKACISHCRMTYETDLKVLAAIKYTLHISSSCGCVHGCVEGFGHALIDWQMHVCP